jgi:F0F1-type ATP synthase membrane subunit b/b'
MVLEYAVQPDRSHDQEDNMGFVDNAKDALDATGKKIGRAVDDAKDRIDDKVDEAKANAKVKQAEGDVKHAEAERNATEAKNDLKATLRDDT